MALLDKWRVFNTLLCPRGRGAATLHSKGKQPATIVIGGGPTHSCSAMATPPRTHKPACATDPELLQNPTAPALGTQSLLRGPGGRLDTGGRTLVLPGRSWCSEPSPSPPPPAQPSSASPAESSPRPESKLPSPLVPSPWPSESWAGQTRPPPPAYPTAPRTDRFHGHTFLTPRVREVRGAPPGQAPSCDT